MSSIVCSMVAVVSSSSLRSSLLGLNDLTLWSSTNSFSSSLVLAAISSSVEGIGYK